MLTSHEIAAISSLPDGALESRVRQILEPRSGFRVSTMEATQEDRDLYDSDGSTLWAVLNKNGAPVAGGVAPDESTAHLLARSWIDHTSDEVLDLVVNLSI